MDPDFGSALYLPFTIRIHNPGLQNIYICIYNIHIFNGMTEEKLLYQVLMMNPHPDRYFPINYCDFVWIRIMIFEVSGLRIVVILLSII